MTRPTTAQRGYGAKWQRTRRRYLRNHPYCEECGAQAVDVHHLDELGPLGPRGHDDSNLQALCKSCHSAITAAALPKRARPAQEHPGLR